MITGLDHVAIAVSDFDAAVDGYRRLLGREPQSGRSRYGVRTARFQFTNAALELLSPDGPGEVADRLRAQLADGDDGLWSLVFTVSDLEAAHVLSVRRGLRGAVDDEGVASILSETTGGIQIELIEPSSSALSPALNASPIVGLDHVVIQTSQPDQAVATYAGRLGLDLRLDRTNQNWGVRQLFFKAGDTVVEMAASLKKSSGGTPDSFGGLAWRVSDPDAAQARIAAAGFNVSEVRTGRKPGTKVFTVRDAPGGAPTIMLSAETVAA